MTHVEYAPIELEHGFDLAQSVIREHLGSAPTRLERATGGLRNLVYQVDHPEGAFVIRISNIPTKAKVFQKEQTVTSKVRSLGIPAPEVVHVGTGPDGLPYMLQVRSAGNEASMHAQRVGILREMGRYAALIHSIRTRGFGHDFGWADEAGPAPTWLEFLHDELNLDARLSVLVDQQMIRQLQAARLREILLGLDDLQPPTLNHGDLRLKNVLVDEEGNVTSIIDWEDCISSVAPQWDWSVSLHDLSIDEKQEFLVGYGASTEAVKQLSSITKALNILNYAPVVERQVYKGRTERLEKLKARLCGALDLFSLD